MGERTFGGAESGEVLGALSAHGCPVVERPTLRIIGRNAVYSISGAVRSPDGRLEVPPDARITQVRHREHRRVTPAPELQMSVEVTLGEGAPVRTGVVDIAFGGLSFDVAPFERAGRLPALAEGAPVTLAVSWTDAGDFAVPGADGAPAIPSRRVTLSGTISGVHARDGAGPFAGAEVEPREAERREWFALVSGHLFRETRAGRNWSERVFRVLNEIYLVRWNPPGPGEEEKRRHEAWLGRLANDFVKVAEIADELDAGHSVVFEDPRGPLGTIAFISLFDGTWSGHQIGVVGSLLGRGQSARRMEVLRKVYDHGFELTQLGRGAQRIAGYCTAAHAWLLDTHFNFTEQLDPDEGYSLPLRMFHLELEGAGGGWRADPRWRLESAPDTESLVPLFEELRESGACPRPRIYREALGLTYDGWDQHRERIGSAAGVRLEVGRQAVLAYDGDGEQPVACAVLDSARTGTNVLGLFDIVHLYPLVEMAEGDRESVFSALLSFASRWFREALGKSTLHYVVEEPERLSSPKPWAPAKELPPHVAALEAQGVRVRDLGLGFYWIIDELRTQDFMEHVFLKTAVGPADSSSGSNTKP